MTEDRSYQRVPVVSALEIAQLVKGLAQNIDSDYGGKVTEKEPLCLLVILKGALFFAADLARELVLPLQIDFIRASSYGSGMENSGSVTFTMVEKPKWQARHILVVDEITDTGLTAQAVVRYVSDFNPKSVEYCSLLDKPARRKVVFEPKYCGRKVADQFLVGYGLDLGERFRNLKAVYPMELPQFEHK